jgi:hypothetical protein
LQARVRTDPHERVPGRREQLHRPQDRASPPRVRAEELPPPGLDSALLVRARRSPGPVRTESATRGRAEWSYSSCMRLSCRTGAHTGAHKARTCRFAGRMPWMRRSRKPLHVVRRVEGSNPSPSARQARFRLREREPAPTGYWTDFLLPVEQRQLFDRVVEEHFVPLHEYGSPALGTVTGNNDSSASARTRDGSSTLTSGTCSLSHRPVRVT